LLQNGFTPLVAACDTFRSAAVEQLAVHCRRLNVELYEKGYRTDPAAIAQEAVRQGKTHSKSFSNLIVNFISNFLKAKVKGKDVVLIDTTGRMQDNLPLMQALAKLVNSVKPDLVLFVGEALVGHDAVDQLVKFNQSLVDLSKEREPRKIDGIILTKFDTIDDKVGAAISMVYTTGQPIVFVGVGQHYTDLKRLNVGAVTKALLKGA
jgi:signal recognition particle receptor subunit alpha